MEALLFDCDGVLVDTERNGHRVAFNETFLSLGLDVYWSIEEYKELLRISGGKERMIHYFNNSGWPTGMENQKTFIEELHTLKTSIFMELIESKQLPLRPGVARIVDEAIDAGVKLAVCSTSNLKAVTRIVKVLLGEKRMSFFSGIFAGDMVSRKKPDPEIYNLCAQRLKLNPEKCCVIEDSHNGLRAAKAAGFNCIVTTNGYTREEDFSSADAVFSELGDNPLQVTLFDLESIIINKQNSSK